MSAQDPGWLVPDQIVFDALVGGFATIRTAIAENTIDRLLERIFRTFSDDRRAQVREWLRRNEPAIILNFPQQPAELPCIAVVIDPLEQSGEYIGDAGGVHVFENGDRVKIQTSRWRSTVGAVVYGKQSAVVLWLHQIAQFILAGERKQFALLFPHGQRIRSRDLGFDERFIESNVFVYRRVVSITVEYDQNDAAEEGQPNFTGVNLAAEVLSGVV